MRCNYFLGFLALVSVQVTHGFCGFYVAKADASLYNQASQVVMVRDEDKTAITMFNDYQGKLSEFALVVPVPEVLKEGQISVGDRKLLSRIDAFTAPRLVEYFDPNPCAPRESGWKTGRSAAPSGLAGSVKAKRKSYGVQVEASYTVGEYDIVILSAKESDGLERWLKDNKYLIPKGAAKVLAPYIKQKQYFFVAKVNLSKFEQTGFTYLSPIQFAFESKKFMLPIRLGMLNAKEPNGSQDLIIYFITKKGRVETTNYRTAKIDTGMDLPLYIKDRFAEFYQAMFQKLYLRENRRVVFMEYGWNMGWCDPCAADPLSPQELRKLGVFWLSDSGVTRSRGRVFVPPSKGPVPAYVTRLHVRYRPSEFPEDLFFQQTQDSDNFQGRYVLRHPWKKEANCSQAEQYFKSVRQRETQSAQRLASLTGWKMEEISKNMGKDFEPPVATPKKWYEKIFK